MKHTTYDGVLTKQHDPIGFEKADAESGILSGYCSKWWEVDGYLEATSPGSFVKTIAERGPKSGANRVLFRYEHEWTVGKHVDITEDATGPHIEAFVSDDGNWGTTLRRHLADGIPYGLSIGFRRIAARPGTKDDPFDLSRFPASMLDTFDPSQVTVLTEVKLLENSAVSFPAVNSAIVESYRSDDHDLTQRAIDRLLADLKADRIAPDQLIELRRLAALVPAANNQDGEMPPLVDPQTARLVARNYAAEVRLALMGLAHV